MEILTGEFVVFAQFRISDQGFVEGKMYNNVAGDHMQVLVSDS